MASNEPAYLNTYRSGTLKERVRAAYSVLRSCRICARECGVNRLKGEKGFCRTGKYPVVSSYSPHFGEEDPLVGTGGSGTIFITHCNLLCAFCQNYDISHEGQGRTLAVAALSEMMIRLQDMGCHNINFVSPSHVLPQILAALPRAIDRGLRVPLVYNTGAYDRVETLKLLEGVFDIYMPDFKFWDPERSRRYLQAGNYPESARRAILEMHRQVGDLELDERGIARRGLLIRHLVMPGCAKDAAAIMKFIAEEVSRNTYVNVMAQYRPCGEARKFPDLARSLSPEDYDEVLAGARKAGLIRLDGRQPKPLFQWI
ncbi:MAG: radical SAM protein [Deltaproteobacteria bacterium]|nr:radical SAM protein [Deltaproteobacteria bacterium]